MEAAGSFSIYSKIIKAVLSECGRFNLPDAQTPTHQVACSPAGGQGKKTGRTGMRNITGQA